MQFDKGVYTVIPTFFLQDSNAVDIDSIIRHIEYQIISGIKNIVLLGTTSETPTLTDNEKLFIVNNVWNRFKNQINIIVGISGNNTTKVIETANIFRNISHALMLTVPYYNKPSQEGIFLHFSKIVSNLDDISIMLYNIPSRCGVNMEPWVIAKLNKEYPNIKAIKEASGSIDQVSKILNLCDITVLSGDDKLTLPMLAVGAKGVVSVASNVVPNAMINLVENFFSNNLEGAINYHRELYPLFETLFIEPNPVPLKYIINKLNQNIDSFVRLPLVNISNQNNMDKLNTVTNSLINFSSYSME